MTKMERELNKAINRARRPALKRNTKVHRERVARCKKQHPNEAAAFVEGFVAFQEGRDFSDNPRQEAAAHNDWLLGWSVAASKKLLGRAA